MAIDVHPAIDERRLHASLEAGRRRASQEHRAVVASTVLRIPACDPLAFFERGAALSGDRLLFMHPSDGYALAGVGAAWTLSVDGTALFERANRAWQELFRGAVVDAPADAAGVGPLAMGGFAFDPLRPATELWEGFPDGLLVVPRYLLTCMGGDTWLTVTTVLQPDGDAARSLGALLHDCQTLLAEDTARATEPEQARGDGSTGQPVVRNALPAHQWKAVVRELAHEMQESDLEKVVLARECLVHAAQPFAPSSVLERLCATYPSCFVFAVARGSRTFLGATPERLVRLRAGEVQAMCLAGSIARGATPEEDLLLGERLLASAKDREEHAVVVRALAGGLAEVCTHVAPIEAPELLKVSNVQHLLTTVSGRAGAGRTVLDMVGNLHPTPAVGGYPREAALRLIREREGMDRGWYAGPIGWLDTRGDGEFAVALRSALVHGSDASLFAGCGIVAGSDPDGEYDESCLKLRPMLAALGASTP
jgi:isochorismate synthase